MLDKTIMFILEVLTCPDADPKLKDGALHMVILIIKLLISFILCVNFQLEIWRGQTYFWT